MKKLVLFAIAGMILTESSWARRGEHDGDPNRDDGNTIVCKDATGANVLQFHTKQLQAQVSLDNYDLAVKSRGSDIGEVSIIDKRSKSSLKSKRLEEVVKTTLISGVEGSVPVVVETSTHRGAAEATVRDVSTGAQGKVQSLTRRGVSRMQLELATADSLVDSIRILCEKLR